MTDEQVEIRKAKIADVERIHALISLGAADQKMLARSRSELYESLRDFFVAVRRSDNTVVACGALAITWVDLAEIRSLAVDTDVQRQGLGRRIVAACLAEARSLGVRRVFVLTYQKEFFERQGFATIAKEELPHKIWSACLKCPKFPDCDEIAMAFEVPPNGAA
ncbi:MAG: N-acetyltransferase [Planctomycetes bacterium]|nr:N-acetyltransferase [Planctomycetota bacterium]